MIPFEDFRTIVSYAMSVLNDRPLTYIYSDIDSEYKALTPSMLLTGYNVNEPPHLQLTKPRDVEELDLSEKYMFLEKLKSSFWRKWNNDYLKDLYDRHVKQKKANKEIVAPKTGDIVLIHGDKLPRRVWKMGRVVEVKVGRGNHVRECTVQTLSPKGKQISLIKRSPSCLVPLEGDPRKKVVSWNDGSFLENLAEARGKKFPAKTTDSLLSKKRAPYRPSKTIISDSPTSKVKKRVTFDLGVVNE